MSLAKIVCPSCHEEQQIGVSEDFNEVLWECSFCGMVSLARRVSSAAPVPEPVREVLVGDTGSATETN